MRVKFLSLLAAIAAVLSLGLVAAGPAAASPGTPNGRVVHTYLDGTRVEVHRDLTANRVTVNYACADDRNPLTTASTRVGRILGEVVVRASTRPEHGWVRVGSVHTINPSIRRCMNFPDSKTVRRDLIGYRVTRYNALNVQVDRRVLRF